MSAFSRKKKKFEFRKNVLSKEADFVLQDENIDLIFEATGDQALALKIIHTAFAKNKKVITANKACLLKNGMPLLMSYPTQILFVLRLLLLELFQLLMFYKMVYRQINLAVFMAL